VPYIKLYKKQGIEKFDCSFPLVQGHHNLNNIPGCTNDDDYYFAIDNPQDGLLFSLTDDPSCSLDRDPWARYLVRDPIYGFPTQIVGVEDAYKGGRLELVPGVYAAGYDSFGGRKLAGKVSCVRVTVGPRKTLEELEELDNAQ
jgi:hypothetical protein